MLTEGWDDSLAWTPLEVAAFVSGRVMGTAEIATTASQTRVDRWAGNARHCSHRKDFIMMTSSIYPIFPISTLQKMMFIIMLIYSPFLTHFFATYNIFSAFGIKISQFSLTFTTFFPKSEN